MSSRYNAYPPGVRSPSYFWFKMLPINGSILYILQIFFYNKYQQFLKSVEKLENWHLLNTEVCDNKKVNLSAKKNII